MRRLGLTLLWLAAAGLLVGLIGLWIIFGSNTEDFEGRRFAKIPPGSSIESVVDTLTSAGVLRRATTFSLMAKATGWGSQIKAGHYAFDPGASNYDLLSKLRRGLQEPVRVTIPPGTRKDVIAAVVAREMAFDKDDFLAALADTALAAELHTDTTHLFAFMLPETYFFYWLTPPETVIRKIKSEFDAFYSGSVTQPAAGLGLSVEEALTVAAIVEWETAVEAEKSTIAGVYLNRLRDGWLLQADPTVQYAVLELEGAKRRLLFKDYRIEHPYNTYLFRGLPPGPVTNPSRSSIEAVLAPERHGYYYFVARGDGSHIFTTNLRDHRRAANEYYRLMRQRRAEAAASN